MELFFFILLSCHNSYSLILFLHFYMTTLYQCVNISLIKGLYSSTRRCNPPDSKPRPPERSRATQVAGSSCSQEASPPRPARVTQGSPEPQNNSKPPDTCLRILGPRAGPVLPFLQWFLLPFSAPSDQRKGTLSVPKVLLGLELRGRCRGLHARPTH